jgi:hypothetical protein
MRAPSFRGVELPDHVRKRRIIVGATVLFAVVAGALVVANVYVSRGYFADLKEVRAVRDRFAFLSRQHTNACSLRPADLAKMAATRLQGSCCMPIDLDHYARQIAGLRAYAALREVPRDPYDVPVALARRLTSYRKIRLTPGRQHVYRRAISLSREHGPCCCRCWRWYAFEGEAHELIARRNWDARPVAALWDLEDGCGGEARRRRPHK